jgi:hypothetical protein
MREVRPLGSTGITPLPRSYGPVRLPAEADAWLWIPTRRCTHAPRRVSRTPASFCRRAPSPNTPGGPMRAHARCFRTGGRLRHLRKSGHRQWIHEAESGSLALGSRLRSRRLRATRPLPLTVDRSASRPRLPSCAGPELHGERAIHMADTSQSARKMRVTGAPKNRRSEDHAAGWRVAGPSPGDRARH